MFSTCPLISKSSSPFINPLVTVPRALIIIDITVTFMFHSFFQFSGKVEIFISLFVFFQFYSVVSWNSIIIIILFYFTTPVVIGGFSLESPQLFRTLLDILVNLSGVVLWTVLILLQGSNSPTNLKQKDTNIIIGSRSWNNLKNLKKRLVGELEPCSRIKTVQSTTPLRLTRISRRVNLSGVVLWTVLILLQGSNSPTNLFFRFLRLFQDLEPIIIFVSFCFFYWSLSDSKSLQVSRTIIIIVVVVIVMSSERV